MIIGRLPIRARMTLAFAVASGLLFIGIGAGLYITMSNALLDELDTGLRFRAASVAADLPAEIADVAPPPVDLIEPNEALVQIVAADGALLKSSPASLRSPVLAPPTLAGVVAPTTFERRLPEIVDVMRLLVVPTVSTASPYV